MDFHGDGEQMTIPILKKAMKILMRTTKPIKNPVSTRTSKTGLQNLHTSYNALVKIFLTWKLSITVPGAQHKFSHHESPTTFFIKFSNFFQYYNYPLFLLIHFNNTLFNNQKLLHSRWQAMEMPLNQSMTHSTQHQQMPGHSLTHPWQARTPRSLWNCQDYFPMVLVAMLLQGHWTVCQDLPRMPDPCDKQASHSYHDFSTSNPLHQSLSWHHAHAQSSRVLLHHCSMSQPFRSSRRMETQMSYHTHCFTIYLQRALMPLWSNCRNHYWQWTQSQRSYQRTLTMSWNSTNLHFTIQLSSKWGCQTRTLYDRRRTRQGMRRQYHLMAW